MGYIYCITNMLNGKQYVGKTVGSINERFKQHCAEYKKERSKDRPLYRAMRKYGIENFIVEQLIQIEQRNPLANSLREWRRKIRELTTRECHT